MSYCRLLILLAVLVTVNCSNAQFGPGQLVSDQHTVATAPGRLLPADVDADGDIDLVLRQLTDVLFFENANGQGDFAPADTIFVVDPIHHLALADMDYDAVLDMVMIVGPNSELIWVAGLGNGQFGSPQLITNFPNGAGAVLCRDVQPDPGPEVLVTSNGQVYIYAYDISTDTYALDDSVSYGGGPPTPVLMSGDVDLDGDVDILAVNWSGFMAMGVNNGPGEAWTSTLMVLTGLMYTNAGMDLVDVDGDGDLDVVDAKNSLKWARNRTVEDGVFGAFDIVDIATDAFAYGMGWVGSLGCGSRTSIIWHVWPWGEPVQWSAYSDQLNAFNGPVALMDSIRPAQLIAADLNGDGANDLLIADRDSSLIWWFPNLLPQTSPSATVVLTPFDTLCASGLSYVLDHAAPAGGSWSGPGVIDNVFTPSGEGIFQLVYTVADGGTGCPLSASQSIVVVQSPTLTVLSGDPFNGCATDPVIFSASPSGGTWAGIASSSGVVDRSCEARPSSGPVVYTMDAVNGGDCTAGGPNFFELLACTPVDLGPDQQVCMKEDTLMVTLQGPFIGAASLGGFDRVQFEPPSTVFGFFHPTVGPGVYEFTGTASGPGACPGFDTLLVTVVPGPSPQILSALDVCAYDSLISVEADTVGVFGGGLSGSGITSDPLDPSLLGPGSYPFTFAVTDANGCETVLVQNLIVRSLPEAAILSPLSVCAYDSLISVEADTVGVFGGGLSGSGITSDPLDPSLLGLGNHPFTFTVTDASGCEAVLEQNLVVLSLPEAAILSPLSVCAYDSLISVEADTVGVFGGGLSGSGITSDPVDPSLLGSGTYPFTFMVTGTNGCQVTLFDSLHVLSVPQVSLELGFTEFLVNGEAHVLTNEGTPPGGVYTLDDDPTPITTINGEGMSLGPHTLFYTYDSLGCVGTASVVFYAEIGTGVHTAPASPFILVPNPAHDQCVVWFPGSATARIMMHDAVGRIVGNWTSVSSPYPLDLGAAPPGTYMLSVEQDGSVRHVRLIVQ